MRSLRILCCVAFAAVTALFLAGCSRAVTSPADELCMYRWENAFENGTRAQLELRDDSATLCVGNKSFSLTISGVYTADDHSLVIYDDTTHMDYAFDYLLHGDSVELTYRDGTLILRKK